MWQSIHGACYQWRIRGGGTVRCPPFGPTVKIFLLATLYEKVRFLPFSSKNCKIQQCLMVFFSYRYNTRLKSPCEIASDITLWFSAFWNFRKNGQICVFHWTFKSKKCFSFRGLRPLDPSTRGSAPGPRLGFRPQTPVIGSRSARSPCPPFAKF